jgi:hypothetical protein
VDEDLGDPIKAEEDSKGPMAEDQRYLELKKA